MQFATRARLEELVHAPIWHPSMTTPEPAPDNVTGVLLVEGGQMLYTAAYQDYLNRRKEQEERAKQLVEALQSTQGHRRHGSVRVSPVDPQSIGRQPRVMVRRTRTFRVMKVR